MTEISSMMSSRSRAARRRIWGFMFGLIAIHFTENITWVVWDAGFGVQRESSG